MYALHIFLSCSPSVYSSTFYNNYILDTNIYLVIHFFCLMVMHHCIVIVLSLSLRAMSIFF